MKVSEISKLINGRIITGDSNYLVNAAYASDLMSDVLALVENDGALLTGLVNHQVIRTAEMLDIKIIVFVRGKNVTERLIEMAKQRGMTLVTTDYTLFETAGILYSNGLRSL